MFGLLSAVQFLTIFPIQNKIAMDSRKLARAMVYFPVIGLLLGLILVAANKLLSFLSIEGLLADAILVILLIILTGGLHLDGLADSADALFSRKPRAEMLQIMRDAHIGAMGALSLISIILLKISLLSALNAGEFNNSLILMCVLSRYSLTLAIFSFPYARQEGKAKAFVTGKSLSIFLLASSLSLVLACSLLRIKGLIIFGIITVFTLLMGKFLVKKIGGLTGDTLGATNELVEVFTLFNMLILTRVWI